MAKVPANPDKFSEYVNNYYSALTGGASGFQPSQLGKIDRPYLGEKQKLGFLGRFVDILSRPMRIVSNPAMKVVEFPERMDKVRELRLSGQSEAATKESLNAVGSLLASPFTGFWSDNPDHKPYWSDIIERQSDVENRNDPNYVDVANNVDPGVKGALGFVGDFVLDPLWLIPGGWAAKLSKEGAKIAKTTEEGAKAVKGVTATADVPTAVAKGQLPEAAALPSLNV